MLKLVKWDFFPIPFRPEESIMSSPSSRRQTMCGVGCPVALQESVKFSPSRTTKLELSSFVTILGGTTTSKYPDRCRMGSVLIWHMYQPRSSGVTLCSCKVHTLDLGLLSEMRGFRVITLLWMVRIVWVSTRTQATCNQGERLESGFHFIGGWVTDRFSYAKYSGTAPKGYFWNDLPCSCWDFQQCISVRRFDQFARWHCPRFPENKASMHL